jgi:hypothetical protein
MATWLKYLLGEGDASAGYLCLCSFFILSSDHLVMLFAGDILATREQSAQMLNSSTRYL